MSYEILREKLEQLNQDRSHFSSSNDVCTPMECVEEMLNEVPTDFWTRQNLKILDPCCGNGNFPAYLQELLKDNNSYEIHMNEINDKRIDNIKELFVNPILTRKDFFEFTDVEEYDMIVANPPYAKFMDDGNRAAKNHGLSKEFVKKSLNLLKPNGYLVYIIPDNWMSLSNRNDLAFILSKYQFKHINIHGAKKYFRGVGSSFTWFVLEKSPNVAEFKVDNFYNKQELSTVRLDAGARSIPLFYNDKVKSILSKTLYGDNSKIKFETTSDLHKYTKKMFLQKTETEEFRFPIWHTQNQKIYSKVPHKFQEGWKTYISLTSYFSTFIDVDCGMTQSIGFIRCLNEKEAQYYKDMLDQPLYKFLNDLHRYGNFNNNKILEKMPMQMTDDVYKEFNITEEEQEFIKFFLDK